MKKIEIFAAITLVAFASMMPLAYAGEKDEYIGAPVKNLQGEKIGSIKDLIAGPDGQFTFAILSHGGIMGIGAKETAVPFEALTRQENDFTLDIAKDRLASAPEYKEGMDLNDHDAAAGIYRFYGITPPWEENMKNEREMEDEGITEGDVT